MTILLTIIHVLVCVFLVIVVLLQSGKAADLAGAFGGMGSQTAFGPRGAATVLSKATTVAAGLFMVTSLTLAILATKNAGTSSSVLERQQKSSTQKSGAPKTATPPGQAAPGQALPIPTQPGAPASAPMTGSGQPYVELKEESSGTVRRVPLDLNKMPKVDPSNPRVPAEKDSSPAPVPAPAKK